MASRYFGDTPITGKMIGEKIIEELPVDIDDLPRVWMARWQGQAITPGKPLPFDQFSMATWVFHDDKSIRVYTLGAEKPADVAAKDWKIRPSIRYTLVVGSPDVIGEEMNVDVWIDEIVNECTQVVADMSSAEMEREAIADYIEAGVPGWASNPTGVPLPTALAKLAEEIRANVHNETDDETDEPTDEPAAPSATATPNGAPAVEAKP
jgi:hypothetical protein